MCNCENEVSYFIKELSESQKCRNDQVMGNRILTGTVDIMNKNTRVIYFLKVISQY